MIRLADPCIPEAAIQRAVDVLRTGHLVQGRVVEEVEGLLRDYLGVRHALLVSSGTAALHLALLALDLNPGDEVIVPAFTYPATANVVELVGGRSVLADIGLDDFNMDPDELAGRITARTRAIMVVHEFGQPADWKRIAAIAESHQLPLIEDAACALGARYDGQRIGTLGKIACFSLHPRKALTTGEGGVVTTADDSIAARVRSLRNHGTALVDGRVDFRYAGLNYRLTEFQAALAPAQLEKLDDDVQTRVKLAADYDAGLQGLAKLKTPPRLVGREMVYQTYHVLLHADVARDELITELRAHGVETNLGAHALNCLTYYRQKYGFRDDDHPCATLAYRQGLALPMGTHVSASDATYVIEQLRRCLA